MALEKLPEFVPEVGTIVSITVQKWQPEKEIDRFFDCRLKGCESYRARVISVSKTQDGLYLVEVEGLHETIYIKPGLYNWLLLSQVYVYLAF